MGFGSWHLGARRVHFGEESRASLRLSFSAGIFRLFSRGCRRRGPRSMDSAAKRGPPSRLRLLRLAGWSRRLSGPRRPRGAILRLVPTRCRVRYIARGEGRVFSSPVTSTVRQPRDVVDLHIKLSDDQFNKLHSLFCLHLPQSVVTGSLCSVAGAGDQNLFTSLYPTLSQQLPREPMEWRRYGGCGLRPSSRSLASSVAVPGQPGSWGAGETPRGGAAPGPR